MSSEITCVFNIEEEIQALNLAQFFKRLTFNDVYDKADAFYSEEEKKDFSYGVLSSIGKIQKTLAEKGYAPR